MQETNATRGRFLAFEGIDGSGKTTQLKRLVKRLNDMGQRCYETREPTDGPIGSMIRQALTGRIKLDNRAMAALFAADRVDHLTNESNGLLPMLDQGIHVVTDRYYFSSYAYHAVDMDMDWVIQANAQAAQLLRPTATVFIDVSPEVSLERISKNRFYTELYEEQGRLTRTRELFYRAFEAQKDVENVIIVNGDMDEDSLEQAIWDKVRPFFL